MSRKTLKNFKNHNVFSKNKHKNAKKATHIKCFMKTCRAKKYKSIFGSVEGVIRSTRQLFY